MTKWTRSVGGLQLWEKLSIGGGKFGSTTNLPIYRGHQEGEMERGDLPRKMSTKAGGEQTPGECQYGLFKRYSYAGHQCLLLFL